MFYQTGYFIPKTFWQIWTANLHKAVSLLFPRANRCCIKVLKQSDIQDHMLLSSTKTCNCHHSFHEYCLCMEHGICLLQLLSAWKMWSDSSSGKTSKFGKLQMHISTPSHILNISTLKTVSALPGFYNQASKCPHNHELKFIFQQTLFHMQSLNHQS